MSVRLNLLVIRSPDAPRLAAFYRTLGLTFELHRHGSGPEHFASKNGTCVFEIYPADGKPTRRLRIGFEIDDVSGMVERLAASGGSVRKSATPSPWGIRAVMDDPDGNTLKLVQPSTATP